MPVKTPIGTAWIDDEGILWHRLDDGVNITGEAAQDTAALIGDMLAARPRPAIVDISSVTFADEEAREIFARLGSVASELATAVLLRTQAGPAPAMLTYFFSRLETDRPVAFFDNERTAVAWARRFTESAPPG